MRGEPWWDGIQGTFTDIDREVDCQCLCTIVAMANSTDAKIYDSLDSKQPFSPAENCAGLSRRLLFARISSTAQTSSIIATC